MLSRNVVMSILAMIVGMSLFGVHSALATPSCITEMQNGKQCFEYKLQYNTAPQATLNPNWSVNVLTVTGVCNISGSLNPQTGVCSKSPMILSDDNMTALKNNVAIMAVMDIHTTSSSPNTKYCPLAMSILLNQGVPEYLNKIYNQTSGLDLTRYVYPGYCVPETGPNPINGSTVVPEFGPVATAVLAISVMITILYWRARQ